MSEDKAASFDQMLDKWFHASVILPLRNVDDLNKEAWERTVRKVKSGIIARFLTSYSDGYRDASRAAKQQKEGRAENGRRPLHQSGL